MPASIPDKKYFKIGEVGEITGLEPHVLRFWESEFNGIRPKKDGGNQRLYTKGNIETILEVKRLLYDEKFTIAGAKKSLKTSAAQKETVSKKNKSASRDEKIKELRKGLEEIRDMLS